jgi:hypothetical protein
MGDGCSQVHPRPQVCPYSGVKIHLGANQPPGQENSPKGAGLPLGKGKSQLDRPSCSDLVVEGRPGATTSSYFTSVPLLECQDSHVWKSHLRSECGGERGCYGGEKRQVHERGSPWATHLQTSPFIPKFGTGPGHDVMTHFHLSDPTLE